MTSLAVAAVALAGCERRAPTVDNQGKGWVPSTTPAERVPSDMRQPVAGHETSTVPSGSESPSTASGGDTASATTTSDIYWVADDGSRHMLHDSMLLTQVQQKLSSAGIYNGPHDGKTSPELAAAIRGFQKKQGLDETGSIDHQTAQAMGLDWSKISSSQTTADQLGSDLKQGASDLGQMLERGVNDLDSSTRGARGEIKNGVEKAGSAIESGAEKAGAKIKEGARDLKQEVHQRTQ